MRVWESEGDLGPLPPFWNIDPVAVLGTAVESEVDEYSGSVGGGFVSVVLNGPDDYVLEVLNNSGTVVAMETAKYAQVKTAVESAELRRQSRHPRRGATWCITNTPARFTSSSRSRGRSRPGSTASGR